MSKKILTQVSLGAGVATSAPLTLTSGTNLTTAAAGAVEYDGNVFYATPNSASRGLLPASQFYQVANSATAASIDDSTTTARSLLGKLLTIVPGVYKFEGRFYCQASFVAGVAFSNNFSWLFTTVTGTNAINTLQYEYVYMSNTTSFATATSPTTLFRSTNTTSTLSASLSTGSRYIVVYISGTMRVSGTGTATFAPAGNNSSAAGSGNALNVQLGSWFSLTPLGAYTATTDIAVGAWA